MPNVILGGCGHNPLLIQVSIKFVNKPRPSLNVKHVAPPLLQCSLMGVDFRYLGSVFSGSIVWVRCVWCMCVLGVCERVCSLVVNVPSSDTVTALHRRQAPCSYMQVTLAAPQSLASNDRKPQHQASEWGRVSACEERTEAGEKRLGEEPLPLPWEEVQAPRPARGGGGEARDGTGSGGWWSLGGICCVDPETPRNAVML